MGFVITFTYTCTHSIHVRYQCVITLSNIYQYILKASAIRSGTDTIDARSVRKVANGLRLHIHIHVHALNSCTLSICLANATLAHIPIHTQSLCFILVKQTIGQTDNERAKYNNNTNGCSPIGNELVKEPIQLVAL